QVTWECWQKLEERYARYQLPTAPWEIHSEASIGKAHLKKMRLTPFRELNAWPDAVMAAVMESYHGGRTETMIRRTAIPGILLDFRSQYPMVFCLTGMHRFLTAQRVDWTSEGPQRVQRLLEDATLEDVLTPRLWSELPVLVRVAPNGD